VNKVAFIAWGVNVAVNPSSRGSPAGRHAGRPAAAAAAPAQGQAGSRISVVIPARNEAETVAGVVSAISRSLIEHVPLMQTGWLEDLDRAAGPGSPGETAVGGQQGGVHGFGECDVGAVVDGEVVA
jgi:hypothetical protein